MLPAGRFVPNLHLMRHWARYLVDVLLTVYLRRVVLNFATESHVDRLIQEPEDVIQNYIIGTYRLV